MCQLMFNTARPIWAWQVKTCSMNMAGVGFIRRLVWNFAGKGVHVDLIKLYGSMELAPLVGLSDAIVDVVSSGNTLKANHLKAVEEIVPISARLIINVAAL